MCTQPITIKNKKYIANKKNKWQPPKADDESLKEIEVPCGWCIECRKRKAREWSIRLQEEIKTKTYLNGVEQKPLFVTLTLSNEKAKEIAEKYNIDTVNELMKKCIRLTLERYRKKNKKSFKHWFTSELGEKNGRIHLHGIMWSNMTQEEIEKLWGYGYVYIGEYVSAKSINYITNYSMKINKENPQYKPVVLCSKGIGKAFITDEVLRMKKYDNDKTSDYYTLKNGKKVALPKYYRNKIYSDEEREKLYKIALAKETIFVNGVEVNKNDIVKIRNLRKRQQEQEENWGLLTGKAGKYTPVTVNEMFNIDDSKRQRKPREKKRQKKLEEYIHGERIWNNTENVKTEGEFTFHSNGSFRRNTDWDELRRMHEAVLF